MRVFNPDGSEAEMCGNGLRCLAFHVRSTEDTPEDFWIETMYQRFKVLPSSTAISRFNRSRVHIAIPPPSTASFKKLSIDQQEIVLYCLDTGVPHAVLFVNDIEDKELFLLAPSIRFHKEFNPKGTNVNFAKILHDRSIAVRTYERGVEQETLACGTGAVAVAIAAANTYQLTSPIQIRTRSGGSLSIAFKKNDSIFTHLTMSGPATKTFEGTIDGKMFGF